jgi:hypothetical protein
MMKRRFPLLESDLCSFILIGLKDRQHWMVLSLFHHRPYLVEDLEEEMRVYDFELGDLKNCYSSHPSQQMMKRRFFLLTIDFCKFFWQVRRRSVGFCVFFLSLPMSGSRSIGRYALL